MSHAEDHESSRRDFLYYATGGAGVVATGAAVWPLLNSLNPAADVLALSTTEVDLSHIEVGQRVTVVWRGNPVFVDHRTPEQIKEAEDVPLDELRDPQADADRVQEPEWLIVVGVCTHLGCIPLGQAPGQSRGDWGGFYFLASVPGSDDSAAPRLR